MKMKSIKGDMSEVQIRAQRKSWLQIRSCGFGSMAWCEEIRQQVNESVTSYIYGELHHRSIWR